MNKDQIIEAAFNTIKSSTEWGMEEDGKIYGYWINGIISVVEDLLEKINKEEKEISKPYFNYEKISK